MPSVLIIDDHKLVAEGTRHLLSDKGYDATCLFSAKKLLEQLQNQAYDLYLLDWNLPDIDGIRAAEYIRKSDPGARIMIYTGFGADIPAVFERLIHHEIRAVIGKDAEVENLLMAIKLVLSGYTIFPNTVTDGAVKRLQLIKKTEALLDEREREIIKAVQAGRTNRMIAEQLNISQRSMEYLLKNIFQKLNIHSRDHMAEKIREMGLIL
ncbi:MAG: response regulator transcription factor [Sporolactobacillus sp.]